jgi:hypothetical protein
MKRNLTQDALFQSLENVIPRIPDPRNHKHIVHSIRDAIFVPFSGFFLQARSLMEHERCLHKAQALKNKKSLFKIDTVPSSNQVRNIIDDISTVYLEEVQDNIIHKMQRSGVLKEFKKVIPSAQGQSSLEEVHFVSLDGFEYFRSEDISCPHCCQHHHKNGKIDYFHRALLSGLVHPTKNLFLPLTQEFIVKQDGCDKEDCERKAAYRWLRKFRAKHPHLPTAILGDDAFCTQPFILHLRKARCGFVLSCKPGSHTSLFSWIDGLRQVGDLQKKEVKIRDGKNWKIETYEYANNVPFKDSENTINVNFVMVTVQDRDTGIVEGQYSAVTDYAMSKYNCIELCAIGKKRWKCENEGHNTLTNNGYHLKHSFGHGEKNLSHNFFMLNIIAFMIHVILEYIGQEGYSKLRRDTSTLHACFERIRGMFVLIACKTWEQFYEIALQGFSLDSS